jgi:hypothetical protein
MRVKRQSTVRKNHKQNHPESPCVSEALSLENIKNERKTGRKVRRKRFCDFHNNTIGFVETDEGNEAVKAFGEFDDLPRTI